MDFDVPTLLSSSAIILAISMLIYLLVSKQTTTQKVPPQAQGAWPIIGHLPSLATSQPAHITLGKMADKYGPIFSIKIGVYKTLIVSSSKIAKECFTTNDKVLANRQKSLAAELMGNNYAMFGFSSYGPYWREIRKIATLQMLSNNRLELLSHIRESEVKSSMKEIHEKWVLNNKALIDMKKWFGDISLNVVSRMIAGERFHEKTKSFENYETKRALKEFFDLTGSFVLADAIPYLRWLDLGGYEKAMNKIAKELDNFVQRWLDQHKKKRSASRVQLKENEIDFMHVLLSIFDSAQQTSNYDTDTIIKSTCLGLILGGADTTAVTLTWALALLLNNPHTLKKAQQELDQHIGRDRQVNMSDLNKLQYLHAIIKETLRLYPPAPLSVPHQASEDCSLASYHISAGTRIIVNLSKLHRDPNVWAEPDEFRPERFFTTHEEVDVKGQHFELIPFGSGRRMCPGISFAFQVMELSLATFLHGFEISTPENEPVEMRETFGLTNMNASPLDLFIKPRLSSEAYC